MLGVGCSVFSAKLGDVETTECTGARRARLSIASAEATSAHEALVGCASHDLDGDRRYSALDCSRLGHWGFLRLHAVVSVEDATLDCCGMDFPLQQDRGGDRGDVTRCCDLGDAGVVRRRIPVGVLDIESTSSSAGTLSSISIARLRALACVFTRRLAHLLAGIRWFALRRRPFGNIYLFSHAVADQPGADAAGKRLTVERVVRLAAIFFSA